jgi:hypothetical protein
MNFDELVVDEQPLLSGTENLTDPDEHQFRSDAPAELSVSYSVKENSAPQEPPEPVFVPIISGTMQLVASKPLASPAEAPPDEKSPPSKSGCCLLL